METDDTGKFVLGSDDAPIEGGQLYQDQAHSRRIEKLSLKVTLISVLVPLAVAVLVAFMYMDMRGKMGRIESSGSLEMSQFEEQLSQRMTVLGEENDSFRKTLDAKIDERLAALNKTVAPVEARIGRTEKELDQVAALKKDISRLSAEMGNLRAENLALKKDMAGVASQNARVSGLLREVQKKSLDISTLKTSNDALKQDVSRIKADMVDRGDLIAEMKKQKVLYQLEIQELSGKIDKKIQALKAEGSGGAK